MEYSEMIDRSMFRCRYGGFSVDAEFGLYFKRIQYSWFGMMVTVSYFGDIFLQLELGFSKVEGLKNSSNSWSIIDINILYRFRMILTESKSDAQATSSGSC